MGESVAIVLIVFIHNQIQRAFPLGSFLAPLSRVRAHARRQHLLLLGRVPRQHCMLRVDLVLSQLHLHPLLPILFHFLLDLLRRVLVLLPELAHLLVQQPLVVVVDHSGHEEEFLVENEVLARILDLVEAHATFFEEALDWLDDVLLEFELVVVHVVWRDQLAHFAAAVRLEGVRMGDIDERIVHAVDYDDGALAILDQLDVAVPFSQNVAQDLSNMIFGHFSQAFEGREQDHGADVGPLLRDEARWTRSYRPTKQNDVLFCYAKFMHQVIVDREGVGQDAIGGLLADVEAVARVLDGQDGNLPKQNESNRGHKWHR